MPDPHHHRPPSNALIFAAGELREVGAILRDAGLANAAGTVFRITNLLIEEHNAMSQFADAIHKQKQQLADAYAARDKAQADADKNAADAKTLSDLRSGGFIADQADVDAAAEVLNAADTTAGGTAPDTTPGAAGGTT
jgi:ATP phosphoribosyltransferase